jgi:hypothetical protein
VPPNKFNTKIRLNDKKICTYEPGSKIWGFYPDEDSVSTGEFDVVFETIRDHQLDFNKISAKVFDPLNFKPNIMQKRNVIPRKGYDKYAV